MHHVWFQYPHLVIQTHCIRILSIKFCTQSKLLKPPLFNFSGILLLEIIASIAALILLTRFQILKLSKFGIIIITNSF
ncbi:hypothetical protein RHGRI_023992 [Rhododendron griersonianum]|uniref:Uncharacterized protein n=1 Tax=Rhododendron griersonianum TaxID=479676 RepID=A0AAV6JCX5_9ERIC|nr:hypothetical protein RHGRI_023992 [Rhododendron griersonianum]